MVMPEKWRKNATQYANVYPLGDVYFKDGFSTRNMVMFGDYEKAIAFLSEEGYTKES